jgi:hypothetical protein
MTEFCCKCHMTIAPYEKPNPVPIDAMRRMHKHCYDQHLRDLMNHSQSKRNGAQYEARGNLPSLRRH